MTSLTTCISVTREGVCKDCPLFQAEDHIEYANGRAYNIVVTCMNQPCCDRILNFVKEGNGHGKQQ